MGQTYQLDLAMNPVAKGRPRFTKGGFTYTPEKTRSAEAELRWHFTQAKIPRLMGPLALKVFFVIPRPGSASEAKRPFPLKSAQDGRGCRERYFVGG